jgi:hypothetical protein
MDLAALLNTLGLVAGILGTMLMARYGVPNITEAIAETETRWDVVPDSAGQAKLARYRRLSKAGLLLVSAAFLLQLFATLLPLVAG